MGIQSQSSSKKLDSNSVHTDFNRCSPAARDFTEVPVLDLSASDAATKVIEACKEYGFFKVINHGVSSDLLAQLESEALTFFHLPQEEKDKASPIYASKRIGRNGDVGWVEYLLWTNPNLGSSSALIPETSQSLQSLVNEYVRAVHSLTIGVLDMVAEALGIEPVDSLSKKIRDEQSEAYFRVNHYPACSAIQGMDNEELVGFGEHTDPQIMSAIWSNSAPGLQVCLSDGTWVSVPADPDSFFFLVGDCLQVMTNGRFLSVKHRVTANSSESRLSTVFFGGPALADTIGPLSSVMEEGETSLYRELTFAEYMKSVSSSRLGDNRVSIFQK